MPTIPIPTDNMYKFMALFGMVLLLSPWVLLINYEDKFFEEIDSLEIASIELEGGVAQAELQSGLVKVLQSSLKLDQSESLLDEDPYSNNELSESFIETIGQLANLNEQNTENAASLKLMQNKLSSLNKQIPQVEFSRFLTILVSLSGLSISAIGFILWYFRLQRYQDFLLVNQTGENFRMTTKLELILINKKILILLGAVLLILAFLGSKVSLFLRPLY